MRMDRKPLAAADKEVAAATRVWLERAVIGLNLCPFAKAVHLKKQIRYAVSAAQTPGDLLADLIGELRTLRAADPSEIDTTLLVQPLALSDVAPAARGEHSARGGCVSRCGRDF